MATAVLTEVALEVMAVTVEVVVAAAVTAFAGLGARGAANSGIRSAASFPLSFKSIETVSN